MSRKSRPCMLLAEIGDPYRMECHITEVDPNTTATEMIEWVKSRDDHLDDALRGRWKHARIYLLKDEDGSSFDDKQHVITVYAIRGRRGGDRYETIIERLAKFRFARSP